MVASRGHDFATALATVERATYDGSVCARAARGRESPLSLISGHLPLIQPTDLCEAW